jgi:hypothetical protein
MGAESREFARQTIHGGFLFFLQFEVHFRGCHGSRMAHGDTACVDAGDAAAAAHARAEGWKGMGLCGIR